MRPLVREPYILPASNESRPSIALSIIAMALIAVSAYGQTDRQIVRDPLVQGVVDDAKRVTLRGNVHPAARAESDLGRVSGSLDVGRMFLVLKRSEQQEQALEAFLQDAQTLGSDSYHKWLTPAEFGNRFGVSDSDVAAVTAWLESHGLAVHKVHPGRVAIEFSGSAAQVEETFRTELHSYAARGKVLVMNASDPQIPAALAPVVAGLAPLHSFGARPTIRVAGKTNYNTKTHQATPAWTNSDGNGAYTFELAPADFAMQYGLGPVYAAGTTGAGQSIGILSLSNVDLSLVQAYRSLFGLAPNVPTVVVDGDDPGVNDAAPEAYLDLEIAGAVAPAATVVMYTSAGTALTDPLITSGLHALEDNVVGVISMSYAECEASLGAAGNAMWAKLWQEAAAQGITVFVSAGDSGSAGCDDSDAQDFVESGIAVNGLGSTPYNVSVGGTDFYLSNYATGGSALSSQIGTYWNATTSAQPMVSLLQAVPEQAWNDAFGLNASTGGVYSASASTIVAGGGGYSTAAVYPATGPAAGYSKPPWQVAPGALADRLRDVPDLSLFAANGANYAYYPICAFGGDCVNPTSTGSMYITSVGGTSAAAPAMAAIQALVNQSQKARQGQANYVYYKLASNAATATTFRDVAVGGNMVPCYQGTLYCSLGTAGQTKGFYTVPYFATGAGYDRATGLGSVDVAKLITNWPTVTAAFHASATTLSITPATFVHGTPIVAKTTVTPVTGGGTPTGDVMLDSTDPLPYTNGLGLFTLSGGTVSGSPALPGGTYQVTARYSGDNIFGSSVSAPVLVTVTPEADTVVTSGWVLNPIDNLVYPLSTGMAIPYGAELYFDAQPVGVNEGNTTVAQSAPATGIVNFADQVGTAVRWAAVPLNSVGIAEWTAAPLPIGSHTLSAIYPGNASYNSSTSTGTTLTVFRGTTTVSVSPLESNVIAGSSVTVDAELYSDYLPLVGTAPTGNISVTLGAQTLTAPLKSWGPAGQAVLEAVLTFTNVPAGLLSLSATYTGDSNWYGSSSMYGTVVSLANKPAPAVTLTAATTSFIPSQMVTVTGTVTGATGKPRPSGNLSFTWEDGAVSYTEPLQAGAAATAATYALTFPASQLANGNNLLVATFKGDANYSAQSSLPLAIMLNGSDFTMTAAAPEVVVKSGNSAAVSVTILPVNGYAGMVALVCSAPAGITCAAATPSPTVGAGVADAITFTLASTLAPRTYPAQVMATGGGRTHTIQILVADAVPASTPTFTPVAGIYITPPAVTILDATTGATIYYTTDGTTPTNTSAQFKTPIVIGATETLKAMAIAPGSSLSAVASAVYTITPPAAMPTFSLAAGTYLSAQTLTMVDMTPGAAIYYTTNGTAPTVSSPRYTGPISVSTTETVKAVAIATGYSLSAVSSASYTITPPAATPTCSPAAGSYTAALTVTIADTTPGAAIYYTINGTAPTTASTRYTTPIVVSGTETIEAVAIATGYSLSAVTSASYTITLTAATPTLSPVAGAYTTAQTVTIADATAGATIYYTTNGTTPTTSSTKYTAPFAVSASETIKAIAIATGYTQSAVASASYTIAPAAATPTFTPVAGTYTGTVTVAIADATAGATIYYTTDGTTPTTASTKYTATLTMSTTETIKAVAIATGYSLSAVGSASYTIRVATIIRGSRPGPLKRSER